MIRRSCQVDWQGPSDLSCSDDLLVIACARAARHTGRHFAMHPDDAARTNPRFVQWETGTSDLLDAYGFVLQPQFTEPR